ncbi:TIGR02206 family membrane protein [Paenibacillus chartarius]|uniref:TIGR02206 family membrane protein n=1 Tax=Paenibacillus chartarius TaxID=747481 RepID=A0ABV6DU78_9BACL
MADFFNPHVADPFVMFSAVHLLCVALLIVAAAAMYAFRRTIRESPPLRDGIRFLLIGMLLVPELTLYGWYTSERLWDLQYSLPLELCSMSLLLSIVMLFTRSRRLYEILYFAGIGGAMMAMLTPNLLYPFPHFRFFHFFIAHIAIILAPLYMTWVEQYRPTWRSLGTAMLFLNVLLVIVGTADYVLEANYMFLRHKPGTPSILDVLGPYPYYLLVEELIAFAVFVLMLLPFVWPRRAKPVA